jgi:hypothetical protein
MASRKKQRGRYQRSKVSHLYLDTVTKVYYARASNAQGRDCWRSLETKLFSVAKARLTEKIAQIQAGKNSGLHQGMELQSFGQAAAVYFGRVKADVTLKPRSINYRRETIEALQRSWPGLAQRRMTGISADECSQWACAYQQEISAGRFNSKQEHVLE